MWPSTGNLEILPNICKIIWRIITHIVICLFNVSNCDNRKFLLHWSQSCLDDYKLLLKPFLSVAFSLMEYIFQSIFLLFEWVLKRSVDWIRKSIEEGGRRFKIFELKIHSKTKGIQNLKWKMENGHHCFA